MNEMLLSLLVLVSAVQVLSGADLGAYVSFGHVPFFVSLGGGRVLWEEKVRNETKVCYLEARRSERPMFCLELEVDGLAVQDAKVSPGGYLYFTVVPYLGSNPLNLVGGPPAARVYVWDGLSVRLLIENVAIGEVSDRGLVFSREGSIIEHTLDGTETTLATLSPTADLTQFAWSPDGTALAFIYARTDHAYLAIYRRGSGAIEFAPTSPYSDQNPTWSPDGTKIGTVRIRQIFDSSHKLRILGYQLMVFDTISKTTQQVYKDWEVGFPFSYGSYYLPLCWADNDTLLYITERTHWLRIFSISLSNNSFSFLTPDGCESPDYQYQDGFLYATHNCEDLNSRGIYKIDVLRHAREVLVPGAPGVLSGLSSPRYGVAPLPDGSVLYLESSSSKPSRIMRLSPNATLPTCYSNCNDHYLVPLIKPQLGSFRSIDGLFDIYLQIFRPESPPGEGGYPVILFSHGGPRNQFFPVFHPYLPYARIYSELQYYASQGYYVVSINFRSGVGQGKNFRDCAGCANEGDSDYVDILGTVEWLKKNPLVDTSRIGITGLSYGGFNVLRALSRNSDLFKAGVSNAGVWNWVSDLRADGDVSYTYDPPMPYASAGPEVAFLTPRWKATVDANILTSFLASPESGLANLTSPLLVMHGDEDGLALVQESIAVVAALEALGRPVECLIVPGETHGFAAFHNYLMAAQHNFYFLKKHL